MIRTKSAPSLAAAILALSAGAAFAQNTTDTGTTTPPTTTDRPSTTTPPVTTTEPAPRTETPAPRTEPVYVPVPVQTAPPATVTLPADQPYPNGFADPTGAYGNDMSVALRQEDGFDWGLLGLLGLFGLLGLTGRRRGGYQHVVQAERVDNDRTYTRR